MSEDKAKTSFKKLLEEEKLSRLKKLWLDRKKMGCWEKASEKKYTLSLVKFNQAEQSFVLAGDIKGIAHDERIYFNFRLGEILYFGTGKYQLKGDTAELRTKGYTLYRLERRTNYRLSVYPESEYYCFCKLEEQDLSNIYDLKTQKKHKDIFIEFLKNASDQVAKLEAEGFSAFRIVNISTGGVSIRVGTNEIKHFGDNQILENLKLVFDKHEVVIPQSRVEHLQKDKGQRSEHVGYSIAGLQFFELSEKTIDDLDDIILKRLKDSIALDKEFESLD